MIEESGAWLLCWLFLVRHPSTSQQEVFLYIPAKSPPFHQKVRIGLSQIKDAIETFSALDETLYLHADRSLNKTPVGLFISCLMDWEMKVSWLLQGCMSLVWAAVKTRDYCAVTLRYTIFSVSFQIKVSESGILITSESLLTWIAIISCVGFL